MADALNRGARATEMTPAVERFDARDPEWSRLAEETGAAPFVHPGWIGAWTAAFASRPPVVLTLRRAGALVGVAPILEGATGTLSPTNWHTPEFGLLAADYEARRELARQLNARARLRLDIGFLAADGPDLGELVAAAEESGHRTQVRTVQQSPYVEIEGNWNDYEARVGSKRLRELRRRRRKLEEQGELTTEFACPTPDELPPLLAEGFGVEGSTWKSERGTAILSQPHLTRLYTAVAEWAAEQGWLTLAFLRLDGRAVAFDFCLEAAGRTYVLKGGYITQLRQLAPRTILLHASLERAFANGLRSYEFLGAADDYKLPWSTGIRSLERFQAFSRSPAGAAGYLAWRYGRPAVKRVVAARARRAERRP